jgi:hypothetical protein
MKPAALATCLAAVCFGLGSTAAMAQTPRAIPPPPPTPPGCNSPCTGPPPPPTPVPTPQPTTVAPHPVVVVQLQSPRVSRGHTVRVSVAASTDDAVTLTVKYHRGKPKISHGKIGSTGTLVHRWKVPKRAPVGKGRVTIVVRGHEGTISKSLSFVVTH